MNAKPLEVIRYLIESGLVWFLLPVIREKVRMRAFKKRIILTALTPTLSRITGRGGMGATNKWNRY